MKTEFIYLIFKIFYAAMLLFFGIFITEESLFAIESDVQFWSINQLNLILNNKVSFLFEVQPRFQDSIGKMGQFLGGSSVNYQLNDSLSVALGYLWTPTYLAQNKYRDEHRVWEQISYRQHFDSGNSLLHRFRLEDRIIEKQNGVNLRLRYGLQYDLDLLKKEEFTYGLGTFNEVFININSTGPLPGFDRNRLFIGPYIKHDGVRVDLGYMPEYVNGRSGKSDTLNTNIYLQIRKDLKLY